MFREAASHFFVGVGVPSLVSIFLSVFWPDLVGPVKAFSVLEIISILARIGLRLRFLAHAAYGLSGLREPPIASRTI